MSRPHVSSWSKQNDGYYDDYHLAIKGYWISLVRKFYTLINFILKL